jgi:hypothetical protein
MDVQTLAPSAAPNSSPDQSLGEMSAFPTPPSGSVGTPPQAAGSTAAHSLQLPQEVAKLFTGGSSSQVAISFQVAHYPNEIVTVFKNSQTGEEITQVPSEIMIKIAEFFDQVAGVLLDKSA